QGKKEEGLIACDRSTGAEALPEATVTIQQFTSDGKVCARSNRAHAEPIEPIRVALIECSSFAGRVEVGIPYEQVGAIAAEFEYRPDDRADCGILEWRNERLQPSPVDHRIVIGEGNHGSACMADAQIPRPRGA